MFFGAKARRDFIKTYTKIKRLSSPSKTLSVFLFNLDPFGVGKFDFGPNNKQELNILIDGDSTAAGYGATSLQSSITGQVGIHFSNKGYKAHINNLSKAGAQVTSLYKKKVELDRDYYDLTIIVVGSNDLFALKNPVVSARSLKKVLDKYSRFSKRIIFMGPGRVDILKGIHEEEKEMYREAGLKMSQSFNSIISKFPNVFYCDPQTLFDPLEKYPNTNLQADDGFHPNDLGYSLYAMDLLKHGIVKFGF